MKDKKASDMSQGDILDSIRKMVETEDNSSILELTDLIDDDGKVTKVDNSNQVKNSYKEADVDDFLRLMKHNESISLADSYEDNGYQKREPVYKENRVTDDNDLDTGRMMMTGDYIHRIVQKTVKDYLDANLPSIAKKIIEHEVVSMLRKM